MANTPSVGGMKRNKENKKEKRKRRIESVETEALFLSGICSQEGYICYPSLPKTKPIERKEQRKKQTKNDIPSGPREASQSSPSSSDRCGMGANLAPLGGRNGLLGLGLDCRSRRFNESKPPADGGKVEYD